MQTSNFIKTVMVFIFSISLGVSSFAQTRPDLIQTGNGARALGLGYAFTAIADDASAMSWNPAGMGQLLLPEASIVINKRAMLPSLDISDQNLDSYSATPTFALSPINFASFVFPLVTRYGTAVIGASYRDVYDWRRSYNYTREYSQGPEYATVEDGFHRSGGITAVTVSGAFAPSERIMIGASLNFLGGSTEQETHFDITGNSNQNTSSDIGEMTSGYSGTAVELGLLGRPLEWLTLGLHFALPYERSSSFIDNNGDMLMSTLHVPKSASLGIAFKFNSSNRLALDIKHQPWSEAFSTDFNNGTRLTGIERQDMTSYHIGYEHSTTRDSHVQSTRLGAFTRPVVFRDAEDNSYMGYGASLGFGWSFTRIAIDIAMNYIYFEPHARWQSGPNRKFEVQENDLVLTTGFNFYF